MPKRDPTADAIAKLAELKHEPHPAVLATRLTELLADRSGYVIGRAADLAAERDIRASVPSLVAAFTRLLAAAPTKDPGCTAKLALAKALVTLEAGYEAEDAMVAGTRHEHWESSWGGQVDLAVGVRGQCAIGLAAMGSREALHCAAELLAECDQPMTAAHRERTSWTVRADAARALTMIGSEGAAALLRFKALCGDPEPAVTSECLAGVIAIDPASGLALAERFLQRDDSASVEAALLAVGGSRRPGSFDVLRRHADTLLLNEHRDTLISAVAMTRQEAAIDYLLGLVADSDRAVSEVAIGALTPLRPLQRIGERLDAAIAARRS